MQAMIERYLSKEQRMMRDTIRAYVDQEVTPFIRKNWQREWDMTPENRPSVELLEGVHRIGLRTLGVPEEFGGTPLDPKTEVQTYAMIAEEIARGDSGLADKLVHLEDLTAPSQHCAPPPSGAMVPPYRGRCELPAGSLPHRTSRSLRSLAAV